MCKVNNTTTEALLEAERISRDPTVKKYTNLDELFVNLEKDDNDDDLPSDIGMVKEAGTERE